MTGRPRKVAPLGIALDPAATVPLHRQIGEQIRRAILERRLAPGLKLPSSRLMAAELNCARGTVLAAIDQLVAEGYLVAQAGSGLSVAADLPDEMLVPSGVEERQEDRAMQAPVLSRRAVAALADDSPEEAVDGTPVAFPTGQPDRESFPFPLWAKLLEREWRQPAWTVAGAPHPFGHPRLRQAIAAYLGMARGFGCEPGAIVITMGVRQSLSLLARLVLDAGDAAWIEEPGFVGTREALASAEVQIAAVPVDASGFPLEAAMALAPRARLAVVAPSHQFPLGVVLSLQRRLALLSWAERVNGWIAEDDFDGEYRYAGRPLAPLRALDRNRRVAYLGSFSKLLFPALRLSYIVLPDALVPAAEKIMSDVTARASMLGQGALARFIADGHFAAHLRRTRLLYSIRQRALIDAARRHLDGLLQIAPDPGGMHLIARPHPDLASVFDDRPATAAAAATSLSVSPLSACYRDEPRVHGLILGYAATPEDTIEPAVAALASALRPLYKRPYAR
ncbi:PLP-dependent aminotransferase family protein [Enhydrobacter sp.]|jgi:GntR family transcriptional regulator/MocR family aminotransferase|uniref:MocR-like pyridoxine biosynthesis transcription factor PdxR n=1 Tax=Enhydrobacter sp. TaxID=1894999 RepID=UPI0026205A79|nr:PLP-dependent aminotransferase family protein [Enhydrobacter sp.]WIM13956.1 MAG: Transcriptional regulator, GntR family domain / Aspartate aminotransferase [Enhydrobacter sp.]